MIRLRMPWLKAAMVAGFLLGILLLVESFLSYRSVSRQLIPDHMNRQAVQYVSSLESKAREQTIETADQLRELLDTLRREESGTIAWLRVVNQQGQVMAESGDTAGYRMPTPTRRSLVEIRTQNVSEAIPTPKGEVMVVALPFRFRLPERGPGPGARPPGPGMGRPRFNLVEVALYMHGAKDPFRPLRRNLVISVAAALALFASMVVILLRLPTYMRGRALEQQLALARRVQQELLPSGCPECQHLEFKAECIPAWEVGGDYYDVVPTKDGGVGLVLGDVSGKGLPAALLMGMLHGAVRAYSGLWNGLNHSEMARELNKLLHMRTSADSFASLFWACYDPRRRTLLYVNAGHLPPVLARAGAGGEIEIHRLEKGGPVLGALPMATYEQGEVPLEPGDLLVAYSDGVVEAVNESEEEFGEARLIRIVQTNCCRTTSDVQQAILTEVTNFTGGTALSDDLTLLVARVTQPHATGEA